MESEDGFFPITSVHRLDIKEAIHLSDEQAAKITDGMMREIARKMADDYCEQLFWDHLPMIVEFVAEREGISFTEEPSKKSPADALKESSRTPYQHTTEHRGERKCK